MATKIPEIKATRIPRLIPGHREVCKLDGKAVLHRFPLYYLPVVVGLRADGSLLERFRSKSYDFNT